MPAHVTKINLRVLKSILIYFFYYIDSDELLMTTVILSHMKHKNGSSLDTKFLSLEKSWYFIGVYILKVCNAIIDKRKSFINTVRS